MMTPPRKVYRPAYGLFSPEGADTALHLVPLVKTAQGPTIEPDHRSRGCPCNPFEDQITAHEAHVYDAQRGAPVWRHKPWLRTLTVPDCLPDDLEEEEF